MKKFLAVAVLLMAIFAMAVPVRAAGVIVTTNLVAHLPVFPGAGVLDQAGDLEGSATGIGTGQPSGLIRIITTSTPPDSISYSETTCLTGTASGKIHIGGDQFDFSWQRVGAVAVLRLTGNGQQGVAVAVFTLPVGQAIARCLPGGAGPVDANFKAVGALVP